MKKDASETRGQHSGRRGQAVKKGLNLLRRFHAEELSSRRKKFYGIWIMHVLFAFLLIIPPLLIRRIIDQGVAGKDLPLIRNSALLLFSIFVAVAVLEWFRHYWGHLVAQNITYDLRNNLYWHLQKLSFSFHDNIRVGELVSRLIDDLNRGEEALYHTPETWVQNAVMIVLTAVVMFTLNPMLALACLAVIATIAAGAAFICRRMFGAERSVRQRKADMSARAEETFAGMRIIQSFVREIHEMQKFEKENRGHFDSRMKAVYWWSWLFPFSVVILGVAYTIAVGVGGRIAVLRPDIMSVGTLTAFIMYLQRLMFPLLSLFLVNEQFFRFMTGLERYFDFMDIRPDIQDKSAAAEPEMREADIEFDDVWFRYQDTPILKGINLKINAGETIALVGPSGAGKTTLTRLLPRFYETWRGSVKIGGVNINDIQLRCLRNNIGIVMQDDYLFSDTLSANITYGRLDASHEEVVRAAEQANVAPFAGDLVEEYETNVGQRGVKLSAGQAQRISIARAILKNPPILILDEATSSVDSETEALIQEALARVMENKTCFVIAHRLSTIINADRICFMSDGTIIEQGTHFELMDLNGQYARYYRLQSETRTKL
ncbi:MAG: ABC transporter ATP-binding protein [Kiritimatiellia bacterium]